MRPSISALLLVLVMSPVACLEVGYVFDENGGYELSSYNISSYEGSDIIEFMVESGPGDEAPACENKPNLSVDTISEEINLKINKINDAVYHEASILAVQTKSPGRHTIEQVCNIYDNLKHNWSDKSDPRCHEVFQFSNETLEYGKEARTCQNSDRGGCIGAGDCDDFAILMSALIEDIGGKTRIILAYGPDGRGHAYTEVYLGKLGSGEVEGMIKWLRGRYPLADKIYSTKDLNTQDVWLNLDWFVNHPGGDLYSATKRVPIYIGDNSTNPLTLQNEPPVAIISKVGDAINSSENIIFDGSQSRDINGDIKDYIWDFSDSLPGERGPIVNHSYSKGGPYRVSLTVEDKGGKKNTSHLDIDVNNRPIAIISITPESPLAGSAITFNAGNSSDIDGKIVRYKWEYYDPASGERWSGAEGSKMAERHSQSFPGMTKVIVNLTVSDNKGAEGFNSTIIEINAPPIADFIFKPDYPNPGAEVTFDASSSSDIDGSIANYTWNFMREAKYKNPVKYKFTNGGNFIVRLEVRDNNGAVASVDKDIKVNTLPEANFSYPEDVSPDQEIIFDASESTDHDGISSYEWDFGDWSPPQSTPKAKISHQYANYGIYNITLKVTDKKGASKSVTKQIAIVSTNSTSYTPRYSTNSGLYDYGGGTDSDTADDHMVTPTATYTSSNVTPNDSDNYDTSSIISTTLRPQDGHHEDSEGFDDLNSVRSKLIAPANKTGYCISLMPFAYNYTDNNGSSMRLSPAKGAFGVTRDANMATNITYDLKDDGWIGVAKKVNSTMLSDTKGIEVTYKGTGAPNSIEIKLMDKEGTTFGFMLNRATNTDGWTNHSLSYDDFIMWWRTDGQLTNKTKKIDSNNINFIDIAISNKNGDIPGTGWIIIDCIKVVPNM